MPEKDWEKKIQGKKQDRASKKKHLKRVRE